MALALVLPEVVDDLLGRGVSIPCTAVTVGQPIVEFERILGSQVDQPALLAALWSHSHVASNADMPSSSVLAIILS